MRRPLTAQRSELARRVGARVRELRLDAEMTQEALARRCGSHRPIISRTERGVHELDLRFAARIARALGIDLPTLLVCLDPEWIACDQVTAPNTH